MRQYNERIRPYIIEGLRLYPFPMIPSEVYTWYIRHRKYVSWEEKCLLHREKWTSNFGLSDSRPWSMNPPRMLFKLLKKGSTYNLMDLGLDQCILSWRNISSNILDNITLEFIAPIYEEVSYGYNFYSFALPQHDWRVFTSRCVKAGVNKKIVDSFVKCFKAGDYLDIPLNDKIMMDFLVDRHKTSLIMEGISHDRSLSDIAHEGLYTQTQQEGSGWNI